MYKIAGVIVAIAIAGPANATDNLADVDNPTTTCTSGMENCVDLCTTDDCVDRCEDTARHCLDHLTAAVDCIVMCDNTYDAEQCFPTCLSGMENCADICTPGSGSLDCLDYCRDTSISCIDRCADRENECKCMCVDIAANAMKRPEQLDDLRALLDEKGIRCTN